MKKTRLVFLFLIFQGAAFCAYGDAFFEYWMNGTVRSYVGLEVPTKSHDCVQRIALVTVLGVQREKDEKGQYILTSFEAMEPTESKPRRMYFNFDFHTNQDLPKKDRNSLETLVQKGQELVVIYSACGSGEVINLRDIFSRKAFKFNEIAR